MKKPLTVALAILVLLFILLYWYDVHTTTSEYDPNVGHPPLTDTGATARPGDSHGLDN
jgi:hypothetical protein